MGTFSQTMKKRFITVMLALLGSMAQAAKTSSNPLTRPEGAMDRRFGARQILGERIGASLKFWLDEQIALEFIPRTRGGVTGGIGARYWF